MAAVGRVTVSLRRSIVMARKVAPKSTNRKGEQPAVSLARA
jgi:hypothetical protein